MPAQRHHTPRLVTALAASTLLATVGACSGTQKHSHAEAGEPGIRPGSPPTNAYQTFDVVWSTVDTQHFDPEHNGVDWQAVRDRYRPHVEETRSQDELRMLLQQMLSELGQSHFVIIPERMSEKEDSTQTASAGPDETTSQTTGQGEDPASGTSEASATTQTAKEPEDPTAGGTGSTGLRLGWVQGEATVVAVEPGSSAHEHGIEPGWRVLTIDDYDPNLRYAAIVQTAEETGSNIAIGQAEMVLDSSGRGSAGESLAMKLIDIDGASHQVTLESVAPEGMPVKFGNLPEMVTEFDAHWLAPEAFQRMGIAIDQDDPPRIGCIRFNVWMFPVMMPFAEAVDTFRDADGIVIDLRGNPGGVGGLAMGIAGHFIDEKVSLGAMTMRDSELNFNVNPQRATMDGRLVEPYAGPLAILVDPATGSTSEIFGAGVQQLGRARIFGRNSMGAALPAHTLRLPSGDVFMYAVANFIGPAGESIESVGVVPDEHVQLTRDRLATEHDPDLKAASDWILSQQSNEH